MQEIQAFHAVTVFNRMAYDLLYIENNMVNKKQIDNLAKYSYDTSKLVTGVAVIGNLIADQFSSKAFWIGLTVAIIFLIFGSILDRLEVVNNDQH